MAAPMTVLVADDSRTMREALRVLVSRAGYEVVVARDGAEAEAVLLSDDAPQLAILDWWMPALDGVEVCRRLRARGREPYTYIILLSGEELADPVAALDAGADDYLWKPFNPAELQARIRAGRRIVELQSQLVEAREELRRQAQRDPLTGAYNRRALDELAGREFARTVRHKQPIGVAVFDLDHFKQVNDLYGHPAGDAVLCETTARVRAALRPYDLLGRVGGEEFVCVLPGCDTERAHAAGERLRAAIAASPFIVDGRAIPVTASVGVAATDRLCATTTRELVAAADAALYGAKRTGRNRVCAAPAPDAKPACPAAGAPAIR